MTGVRTTNDPALPSQSIDIKTTERWQHLDSLPLEGMREAMPLLLIGQDNYHLIVPRARQIHEGPANAPVATQTKVGWIVHGNTGQFRNRLEPQYTCAIFSKYADESLHQLVKESFVLDALGTCPLVSAAKRSTSERRTSLRPQQSTQLMVTAGRLVCSGAKKSRNYQNRHQVRNNGCTAWRKR